MFIGARVLGKRFADVTRPGEAVGLLLPNANAVVLSLLGLLSGGRVAAMINYTAGPASVSAAVATAAIRRIVSSRAFIEKAGLADIVAAAEKGGATFRLARGCARRRRHDGKALGRAAVAASAAPPGWRVVRHHPVHLRIGRHAEGRRAVAIEPARQRHAGRGADQLLAGRQAAQRAAGVPLVRADRRHHPAAGQRRAACSSIPRRFTTRSSRRSPARSGRP